MNDSGAPTVNGRPLGAWVARVARALGGFVAAILIGILVLSYSPIDLVAGGATERAGSAELVTLALGLLLALPAAFGIVLALGWREDRPVWAAGGFLLGCALVSAVLISTKYATDEGVALAHFPNYALVAAAVAPAIGAVLALVALRRRGHRVS